MLVKDKYFVICKSKNSAPCVYVFDTRAEALVDFLNEMVVDSDDEKMGEKIVKAIESGYYELENGTWFSWGKVKDCSLIESSKKERWWNT